MDEKISLKAVDAYSEKYASKIAGNFFAKKEKITGSEILALCDIQQINMFVISELLHSWKNESAKLKSPYFNYQAQEVTQALNVFQNVLSNNISIAEPDFLLLLEKAVAQTLYIILDPYDFYSDTLDRQGHEFISVDSLKSDVKYLRINKDPLQQLIQKLEEKKLTLAPRNEVFAMLDTILEEVSFTPEDIEHYVLQFSRIIPLDLDILYELKDTAVKAGTTEIKLPPVIPKAEPEQPKPKPEPAVNRLKVPAAITPADKTTKSVAENLQKIARIKDSLTINQKFMFTKILFHGDFEIFSQAVDRLDTMDNMLQAEKYLENTYPEWDKESIEYLEFQEMLEKRFS